MVTQSLEELMGTVKVITSLVVLLSLTAGYILPSSSLWLDSTLGSSKQYEGNQSGEDWECFRVLIIKVQ